MVQHGSQMNNKRGHHFYSGAVAGVAARTATAPLDQLKTQQQVRGLSLTEAARACRGKFFRGNAVNCLKAAPQSALQFGLYNVFRDDFGAGRFRAGVAAGACAFTCSYPLELLKLHLQTSDGLGSALRNMRFASAPLAARGFGLSLVSYSCFFATQFTLYQEAKEAKVAAVPNIMVSAMASIVAAVVWFPMDTLRKTVLVQRPFVPALAYRGCFVGCCKTVPFISIRIFLYEQILVHQQCSEC